MCSFKQLKSVIILILWTAILSSAQQRPREQQDLEKVAINTGEVPFDVVVRDKRGRPVKDLQPSDFDIYEDNVKQELISFRLITAESGSQTALARVAAKKSETQSGDTTGPAAAKSGSAPGSGPGITAVALVFDRLTPDARTRAYKAALSYLGDNVAQGELVGVFLTDLSLVVLQPYTDDLQLAQKGVEKAAEHASSLYTSNNQRTREMRDKISGVPTPSGPSADISAEIQSLQFQLLGLERWEEVQRDQQGNATTRGLLVIAESLRQLPGRKAVIFFSEGLALPPDVMESFRSVISSANRANVSFYTIDAAGLRAESKTAETNREIASRSNLRMAQEANNTESTVAMTKGLERNEDLLRLNPDSGLGQLANQTGGFLITDTNDLKSRLQKIDEDLHTYYLMSYTSKNQNFDGHFRKIDVKLKRSGLTVQSRKGYYAIKGAFASPVLPYEVPALAALSNAQRPQSFPFHAVGFSFPERERTGLAPVMVEVPMSDFTLKTDKEKNLYNTDFSIVVLLKDQAGQVVEKLSNQYRLSGPLDKLDETRQRQVLFYREADLAPGRYTLEAIAYDAPTGRASVRTSNIDVPDANDGKLRLSSIVIIKRAEQNNAAAEKENNPFHLANMIVYPNLGEPVRKTLKQLPFFFTVYTPTGTNATPKLTIELRQQGRTLAQIPGEMPAPDALGRIQYMAGLPLEKIPAGSYELRITVNDGTSTVTRSADFAVEN
jgi:VWFA-related protein